MRTKRWWRISGLGLGLVLLAGALAARQPIAAAANATLGFGQVITGRNAGTVTITPAGSRTATGGVALGSGLGASPASFLVTGEPSSSYSVTLPAAATLTGGSGTMSVDAFVCSPSSGWNLGSGGSQLISIGATLRVNGSQPAANYSGSYSIIVSYE